MSRSGSQLELFTNRCFWTKLLNERIVLVPCMLSSLKALPFEARDWRPNHQNSTAVCEEQHYWLDLRKNTPISPNESVLSLNDSRSGVLLQSPVVQKHTSGVLTFYHTHQNFLPRILRMRTAIFRPFSHAEQQYLINLHYCKGRFRD